MSDFIETIEQNTARAIEKLDESYAALDYSDYLDLHECISTISTETIDAWNQRADGWISVDERLPEFGQTVLIYNTAEDPVHSVMFDEFGWHPLYNYHLNFDKEMITHWMPLPTLPERG